MSSKQIVHRQIVWEFFKIKKWNTENAIVFDRPMEPWLHLTFDAIRPMDIFDARLVDCFYHKFA